MSPRNLICSAAIAAILFFATKAPVGAAETPPEPYRIPLSAYAFKANAGDSIYGRDVDAGTLRISFSNLVPSWSYDISWHTSRTTSPELTIPDLGARELNDNPCQVLEGLANDLWHSRSEAEAGEHLGEVLSFEASGACGDATSKAKADAAVAATRWRTVIEAKIEPGSVLEIRVTRKNAQGVPESATFVIRGPEPSRFFQTYGFSYFRDHNEGFFTEKNPAGKFVIREKTRRSDWQPAGLLLINYRLGGPWTSSELGLNLAGALSFDGEEPAVGLGLNLTFANNIGLVAGLAMSRETRLRGQYRAGDAGSILDAGLESDQLVDKAPHTTWFVGLSLNLSSNPFKKKVEATTAPAAGSK